jgi:energy-coupling factor transporter ATP-binding protein EcfA2
MIVRELIGGPNFSGRSAALLALLRNGTFARESFYIGPYAEAALSGLASTVADEIALYRTKESTRPGFSALDVAALARRQPQTLSGGEQVLLALHCFSQSRYAAIAIDTALEQLDRANRDAALAYLDPRAGLIERAALIDNRLPLPQPGWAYRERAADTTTFDCNPVAAAADLAERQAPAIVIRDLAFTYRDGKAIFRDVALTLAPGAAYRVAGPNGAGKSTLLKLLVGVLAPSAGVVTLGGEPYRPWREGNRAIALGMQNPDHQWCGATLAEDLARRQSAFARHAPPQALAPSRLASLARSLGAPSSDAHLYELPLAARKRLSWLWPLSGALPWIMLDEPTIGQDSHTRRRLAAALSRLASLGYGVLFVTHDDDFADQIAHRVLAVGDRTIKMP